MVYLVLIISVVLPVWVLLAIIKAFKVTLHRACKRGKIEAVKKHLASGADVNAKDEVGDTPFYFAAEHVHQEIAELLIAKRVDVNVKCKE